MSVDITWIEKPYFAIGQFPSMQDLKEISEQCRVLINVTHHPYSKPLGEDWFTEYLSLPVEDMSVPTWQQLFLATRYFRSYQLMKLPVFLHCYAGLGRSGLFAALFCMTRGMSAKEAIEHVREVRLGAIETDEQLYRLYEFEPIIQAVLDSPEQTWFEATHMIHILRRNCPWDRVQTFESLIRTIMDESFEVIEAIRKKDMNALEEEVGDMMMQPMILSEIASEIGSFSMQSSLSHMMEKLIHRHPHVFLKSIPLSPDGVIDQWNGIKLAEYPHDPPGIIGDIMAISREASDYGFDWEKASDIIQKIQEELHELDECIHTSNKRRIEEELGDLFFALFNIARFLKIDPHKSLERGRRKFETRFRKVQKLIHQQGKDPKDLSPAELDAYWNQAKAFFQD